MYSLFSVARWVKRTRVVFVGLTFNPTQIHQFRVIQRSPSIRSVTVSSNVLVTYIAVISIAFMSFSS